MVLLKSIVNGLKTSKKSILKSPQIKISELIYFKNKL